MSPIHSAPSGPEREVGRLAERRAQRQSAVPASAAARDAPDDAVGADGADQAGRHFAEIERAVLGGVRSREIPDVRRRGWTAIAARAADAGSRDGGDDCLGIDAPNSRVRIAEIEAAIRREADVRRIEIRRGSRPAVALRAARAGAGECRDDPSSAPIRRMRALPKSVK